MACNQSDARLPPDRPPCTGPPNRPITPSHAQQVTLEEIVGEAVDAVAVHNVTPFDAADWAAAHYNYVDLEAVLQQVREGVDQA